MLFWVNSVDADPITGTVSASIADIDFVKRREGIEEMFEDGTVSFLSIVSIRHGFKILSSLTASAISRLGIVDIIECGKEGEKEGAKVHDDWKLQHEMGPIISFNLKRPDGSWYGYREVEKLASLSNIQLRTGCFCNPGACAKYLGLSHLDLISNTEAGHVCWDDHDIINGKPVGAVRVSFGYMSTYEDAKVMGSNRGNNLSAFGVRLHTSTLPEPHLVGASCTGLPAFSFMGSSHLNLLAGSNSGHHDSMNFVILSNIAIVESIENQRQLQVPKTGTEDYHKKEHPRKQAIRRKNTKWLQIDEFPKSDQTHWNLSNRSRSLLECYTSLEKHPIRDKKKKKEAKYQEIDHYSTKLFQLLENFQVEYFAQETSCMVLGIRVHLRARH
ncbi:hypothetical protein V8G54_024294 [Vigna mungo]|uniref:Molybdenum cofactor sulfurase n=1 Tax=Vigna mungo TaxID=3915 RepID=A0AAQ3N5B8_VIGMU